ncbi:hypothetical protein J5O04_11380 [Corynebacterium hindlerae]|uniref:hypothetical protein n=1 Tax=Corynebacterium hindlerae TaxID=699041 RepID=UPI001AD779E9|nr:hypothetical protein [Corynebacterium hindlerae]QTH59384.1 hypothetical protein J5O04_11380 [Corynebacterium hindlerae]
MKIQLSPIPLLDHRSKNLGDYSFWRDIRTKNKIQIHGHIFADRDAFLALPPWERSRIRALACGYSSEIAVVCGLSAARLWKLPVIPHTTPTEMALPLKKRSPRKSVWPPRTVYRNAFLPTECIIRFTKFSVTTPARTVIDTARWHDFATSLAVADGFLRNHGTRKHLLRELDRIGRAKGSAQARRVIDSATPLSMNAAESWARAQILESHLRLSSLKVQAEIWAEGQQHFADLLINNWLIVEVDGDQKYSGRYGSELEITAEELRREKRLKNKGFEFLRVNWAMLQEQRFIPALVETLQRPSRRLSR